jgi:hypothetical protein
MSAATALLCPVVFGLVASAVTRVLVVAGSAVTVVGSAVSEDVYNRVLFAIALVVCLSVPASLGAWTGVRHRGASRSELIVRGVVMVAVTGLLGAVDLTLLVYLAGDTCFSDGAPEATCVPIWSRPNVHDLLPGIYLGIPGGAVAGLVQTAGMAAGILVARKRAPACRTLTV